MELRKSNAIVGRGIIEKYTNDLPVSQVCKDKAARNQHPQPGHIERAGRVTRSVSEDKGDDVDGVLDRLLSSALRDCTTAPPPAAPTLLPCGLDVFVPDTNLARLTDGLKRHSRRQTCLYGVPDSGKTVYAHSAANDIGRPLLAKRDSDLISKYIGETEKHLSQKFRQA